MDEAALRALMRRVVVDCNSSNEETQEFLAKCSTGVAPHAAMQQDTILNFQNHTVMHASGGPQGAAHQSHHSPSSGTTAVLWDATPSGGRATIPLPSQTNKLIIDVSASAGAGTRFGAGTNCTATATASATAHSGLQDFRASATCESSFTKMNPLNIVAENAWASVTGKGCSPLSTTSTAASKIQIKFDQSGPTTKQPYCCDRVEPFRSPSTEETYDSDFESDSGSSTGDNAERESQRERRKELKKESCRFYDEKASEEVGEGSSPVMRRKTTAARHKFQKTSEEQSWLSALLTRRCEERKELEETALQQALTGVEVVEPEQEVEGGWVICE